jgi:hypothetical protein
LRNTTAWLRNAGARPVHEGRNMAARLRSTRAPLWNTEAQLRNTWCNCSTPQPGSHVSQLAPMFRSQTRNRDPCNTASPCVPFFSHSEYGAGDKTTHGCAYQWLAMQRTRMGGSFFKSVIVVMCSADDIHQVSASINQPPRWIWIALTDKQKMTPSQFGQTSTHVCVHVCGVCVRARV